MGNRQARIRVLVRALCLLLVGTAMVWAVSSVALGTRDGQRYDERARLAAKLPDDTLTLILDVLGVVSVSTIAVVLAGYLILALIRRRIVSGMVAVVLVAGANITTQVLKYRILDRPNLGWGSSNTLPSGHTTVLVSLSLAALVVLPRIGRRLQVAIVAAVSTLVGVGTMLNGWHRPSDVLAALGVCAAWAGIAFLLTVAWSWVGLGEVAPLDTGWRRGGSPSHTASRAQFGPSGTAGAGTAGSTVGGRTGSPASPAPDATPGPFAYTMSAIAGSALVGIGLVLSGLGYGGLRSGLVLAATSMSAIGLASAVLAAAVAPTSDLLPAAGPQPPIDHHRDPSNPDDVAAWSLPDGGGGTPPERRRMP